MPGPIHKPGLPYRALLRGLLTWLLASAVLLPVFSFAASRLAASSSTVSILGSLLSFLSSAFAGAASARYADSRRLLLGILVGALLAALLSLIGFLIGGRSFHPDGFMSMLSFTLAGAMVGSVFFQQIRHCGEKEAKKAAAAQQKEVNHDGKNTIF